MIELQSLFRKGLKFYFIISLCSLKVQSMHVRNQFSYSILHFSSNTLTEAEKYFQKRKNFIDLMRKPPRLKHFSVKILPSSNIRTFSNNLLILANSSRSSDSLQFTCNKALWFNETNYDSLIFQRNCQKCRKIWKFSDIHRKFSATMPRPHILTRKSICTHMS